jgi:glycosyltransferase involved in cell wall biosynthesis
MSNAIRNLSPVERRGQRKSLSYVLITPARNESKFIERTIQSVIKQTVLPLKWVIVSDGSTDGTDDIVKKYTISHKWIDLVRMPERTERHFAGKVHAFNQGYERLGDLDYDLIASLDADLCFDEEYFSFLIDKFLENPRLGVGGTPFREDNRQYDYRFTSIEHVSGACQFFRRQCFEEIGGYKPIKEGGIDLVAVTTARMKNWETRTFTEKVLVHYRGIGTGHSSVLKSRFRFGKEDYYLGGHPIWEIFRTIYQMTKKPYVIGGLIMSAGYLSAYLSGMEKPISKEFVEFRRKEQMARLKSKFYNVPAHLRRLTHLMW